MNIRIKNSIGLIMVLMMSSSVMFSLASHSDDTLSVSSIKKNNDVNKVYLDSQNEGENLPYTLTMPTLENRFSVTDEGEATLFAPYMNEKKGWYDSDKTYLPDLEHADSAMCWAHSSANLLAWYFDTLEVTKSLPEESLAKLNRNPKDIFNQYHEHWNNMPFEYLNGLSWYFTGKLTDENYDIPELRDPSNIGGGYLKDIIDHVPYNTHFNQLNTSSDEWQKGRSIYGNLDEMFPFIEQEDGIWGTDLNLSTIESFSKTIIRMLHYGAAAISVGKENSSGGNGFHGVNLWGCSYDEKTGLVNKLYLTDNSDQKHDYFFTVGVEMREGNRNGIKLTGYAPVHGDLSNFTKINDITMIYAAGVINNKDYKPSEKGPYEGEEPQIQSIIEENNDVIVNPLYLDKEYLYGISYYKNGKKGVRWQANNRFSNLDSGSYYFFVKVKENESHFESDVSKPVRYRVKSKVNSNNKVKSLTLGADSLKGYGNNKYNHVWFGNIDGNPLRWRVLDDKANHPYFLYNGIKDVSNNDAAFLMSDSILDFIEFNGEMYNNQNFYRNSNAFNWVKEFELNSFLEEERNAAMQTNKSDQERTIHEKVNNTDVTFDAYSSILYEDRFFLPSIEEMIDHDEYGFNSLENRKANYFGNSASYWTRSRKQNPTCVGYINGSNGNESLFGEASFMRSSLKAGIRPAFNLDKTQILYTSTSGSLSDSYDEWSKIEDTYSDEFKITLKDRKRDFFDITNKEKRSVGINDSLNFNFKSSSFGKNEYISVIILDSSNNPTYYKNVYKPLNNNGSFSFKLPSSLKKGEYTLKIFNEQVNGERETNLASPFIDVKLELKGNDTPSTPVTVVSYSVEGDRLIQHLSNGKENIASLKVKNKEVTYRGNEIDDNVILQTSNGWIDNKPVVKYENNLNVGEAKAFIEVSGQRLEVKFNIVKANNSSKPVVKSNEITEDSITLDYDSNYEYRLYGTDVWLDTNVFDNLSSDTLYTFEVRIKESPNFNPSEITKISLRTLEKKENVPVETPSSSSNENDAIESSSSIETSSEVTSNSNQGNSGEIGENTSSKGGSRSAIITIIAISVSLGFLLIGGGLVFLLKHKM